MIFDTHTHLDDEAFDDDREAVFERARAAGVTHFLLPSADRASNDKILSLVDPTQGIYGSLGLHPHHAEEWTDAYRTWLMDVISKQRGSIVAIGECGLDYYYDHAPRERQKQVFDEQIRLAFELDLPLIIHDRDAHGDCLEILQAAQSSGYLRPHPGVFHCYSGSAEFARAIWEMGFYLGFDGPITFKNARHSHEVLAVAPRDRIVLETDSPYLSPEPLRGKRNESANLTHIVAKLAELWDLSLEATQAQCFTNSLALYEIEANPSRQ